MSLPTNIDGGAEPRRRLHTREGNQSGAMGFKKIPERRFLGYLELHQENKGIGTPKTPLKALFSTYINISLKTPAARIQDSVLRPPSRSEAHSADLFGIHDAAASAANRPEPLSRCNVRRSLQNASLFIQEMLFGGAPGGEPSGLSA